MQVALIIERAGRSNRDLLADLSVRSSLLTSPIIDRHPKRSCDLSAAPGSADTSIRPGLASAGHRP